MKVLAIALLAVSFNVFAQNYYITGVQKITFRSGPGTENKIIKMLETDSKVTVLERGEEWSKVRDSEGVEGYVLNRFLDESVPYSLRYKWLKSEYDKLKETHAQSLEAQKQTQSELSNTKNELAQTQKSLEQVNASFEELKAGSANYLQLKEKFDKTTQALDDKRGKVKDLESQLIKHYIYWFLAGAGVLFLGWIIGSISRKKKGYGSSIRL